MPSKQRTDVDKLLKAIEEAKEITREMHGAIKDGHALLRELKTYMQPTPDMLAFINVAIDKHVGEQAVKELDYLHGQIKRDLHGQIKRDSTAIHKHFDRMMEALTGGQMADLESLTELIEQTAKEDPLKAKMALMMASKYADVANERIAIIDLRD